MEFQFSKVLQNEAIDLDVKKFANKDELLVHLTSLLKQSGKIKSEDEFLKSLYEREDMGSTYMGNYIAIPHGKSETVTSPSIAFCRCSEGISYESCDEVGLVKLIFMLAIPKSTAEDDYILVLSTLARLLMHEEFIDELYAAKNYEDVIKAIKETESLLVE